MNAADDRKNDAITDEAADWFQAMRETDVPEATRARFADWLVQSPGHGAEYLRLVELWDDLGAIDAERRIDVASLADEGPAGNVSRLFDGGGTARNDNKTRRFLRPAGIAAALAMLAGILWFALDESGVSRTYETALGEQRSFALEDGSVIHLNTRSGIRVRFEDDARRVELLEGEALFDVARDTSRPFVVSDGNVVAQALGTRFNVYRRRETTEVTVIEGRVAVSAQPVSSPGNGPGGRIAVVPRLELASGEQAEVRAAARELERSRVDVENVTAWTVRRLKFARDPVREVVAEFNRYNRTELRVADASLAGHRFTGSFDANKPQDFIDALHRLVEFDVERQSDGALLLKPQGPGTPGRR